MHASCIEREGETGGGGGGTEGGGEKESEKWRKGGREREKGGERKKVGEVSTWAWSHYCLSKAPAMLDTRVVCTVVVHLNARGFGAYMYPCNVCHLRVLLERCEGSQAYVCVRSPTSQELCIQVHLIFVRIFKFIYLAGV